MKTVSSELLDNLIHIDDDERWAALGEKIAEELKVFRHTTDGIGNEYDTPRFHLKTFGDKTAAGLARTVVRLLGGNT